MERSWDFEISVKPEFCCLYLNFMPLLHEWEAVLECVNFGDEKS